MIKLIWDFRSIDGEKIAEHHVKHLNEYIQANKITNSKAEHSLISPNHWIAFITTPKTNMIQLRDALKPQRGEVL